MGDGGEHDPVVVGSQVVAVTVDVDEDFSGQQVVRLLVEVVVAVDGPAWSEPGQRNLQMHRALVRACHHGHRQAVCEPRVVGNELEAAGRHDGRRNHR